jgi:hypothetical protein
MYEEDMCVDKLKEGTRRESKYRGDEHRYAHVAGDGPRNTGHLLEIAARSILGGHNGGVGTRADKGIQDCGFDSGCLVMVSRGPNRRHL